MPARKKTLISVATFVVLLLGFARPAAAATWTTEPVPAGPGGARPGSPLVRRPGTRAVSLERGSDGVAAALHRHGLARARRRLDAPGEPSRRGLGQRSGAAVRHDARAVRERPGRLRRRVQPGEAAPRRRLRPLGRQRRGELADARALRDGVRRGGQSLGSGDRALRRRRPRPVDDRAALGREVRQGDEGLVARRVHAGRRDQRARRPDRRVDPVRAHRGARAQRGPAVGARCSTSRRPPAWRTPRCGRR